MTEGHYTAFARGPDGTTWYHFNDTRVTMVDEEEVSNSQAFMLFYQQYSSLG